MYIGYLGDISIEFSLKSTEKQNTLDIMILFRSEVVADRERKRLRRIADHENTL